jgi:hypothetical protein
MAGTAAQIERTSFVFIITSLSMALKTVGLSGH